jgi:pimeloyl-ACP methyl ester carboxylesterase
MTPERFQIAIPEERLQDMRRRLKATSWPGDFGNEKWTYGVEEGWLREMVDYWANDYDWRKEEARMNAFPHFRVTIDGVPIHFIHIKSGKPGAIPLILTHGWPWTFWDWHGVLANLTKNNDSPAFDLVVPSLPGIAFSSPLRTTGVNVRAVAKLWVKLMCNVLGYAKFASAGGDWGSLITAELGHAHPERLLAIHLTLVLLHELIHYDLKESDYAPDEKWMWARNWEALPWVTSHVAVHGADPQTLAYALADSPVGTAAWIWERRRAWSDCDGDIVAYQGRDFLCTTASLYWLTNTIGTSMRMYKEHFTGAGVGMNWPLLHKRQPQIPVPTGVAVAPKELGLLPRAVVAARTNLKRWQMVPRGGHFLPSEQPDILADEYRAYFSEILKQSQ